MKEKKENILKQLKSIDKLSDSQIDYSDSKDLGDESWADFKPFVPYKKPITIRLDADVIDYFKSLGKGYQTKINSVLQEYKKHHPR